MGKIMDYPLGAGMEFILDETSGILTFELKGVILGLPQDIKVPISVADILTSLEAQVTNPFQKWALGMLINLL